MVPKTKRTGKQWSALLVAGAILLAGLGLAFPGVSAVTDPLLHITVVVFIGSLAFLAIGRAWEVGQDLLAFIGSILLMVALAPIAAVPLFGSEWIPGTDSSAAGRLLDLLLDFSAKEVPTLLRFYLLVLVAAALATVASLVVPRPSQRLPRSGRWLEGASLLGLALIFALALLVFSGAIETKLTEENLDVLLLGEALLVTLVAYIRWGNPVPEVILQPPPEPKRQPSAAEREALRQKGRSVRASTPPPDLPNLDEVPLPPGPAEETTRPQIKAPPGSPGSLEPAPGSKPAPKPSKKPRAQKPPQSPGWYPDPFAESGQRYWDGKRWGQQTRP